MAETLGVRTETVANWERGQGQPLARHYGAIVRFLGYDPEMAEDTLASRLRAMRRRLGLTQEQLAALAGLDEGSVCRWESGSRRPCRWMAARVEAILERLESEATASAENESTQYGPPDHGQDLSYFDVTRWRRKPPPGLLPEKLTTLGDRIRRRRLELGFSQEGLGKRLGVRRVTVYRWERNEASPSVDDRPRVLRFLGNARPSRQKRD